MKWQVTWERPAIYQAENPLRAGRPITTMTVEAPTEELAIRHVIRTVSGDLGAITAVPSDAVPELPVNEVLIDRLIQLSYVE